MLHTATTRAHYCVWQVLPSPYGTSLNSNVQWQTSFGFLSCNEFVWCDVCLQAEGKY